VDRCRRTYYIRKQVGGRRYEVNTGASTATAAHEQLRRFQADPEGYDPRGERRPNPIHLDEDLSRDFLAWPEREKGNSSRWVGQQRLYLAWWAERLRGVDLRRARLADHVMPALRGATAKAQRIAVLKVLYAWLRKERHVISAVEDPTLGTLMVPQAKPAQLKRSKVVPREHLDVAIEHLASDRWRDLLRVLGGTGMHVAELERFARDGAVEPLPRDGACEGAAGAVRCHSLCSRPRSARPRARASAAMSRAASRRAPPHPGDATVHRCSSGSSR
jgi:hypothetical protein